MSDPCDLSRAIVDTWQGLGLHVFTQRYGVGFLVGVALFVLLYKRGPEMIAAFGSLFRKR